MIVSTGKNALYVMALKNFKRQTTIFLKATASVVKLSQRHQ